MLLAQLHRKVPSEFEGMEDVLTSSVFGLLKYLPDRIACALLAEFAAIPLPQGPIQLELWPRYPTPPGFHSPADVAEWEEEPVSRGDTEPDAVIMAGNWLLLMEAKYRSPLDETYDQLGREFSVGYRLAQDTGRRFKLLVVTGHTLQPAPAGLDLVNGVQMALTRASAGLRSVVTEMIATVPTSLRWTNWQHLYSVLSKACQDRNKSDNTCLLVADVCRLLELRGFKPYDNQSVANALTRWERAGIPDEAWSVVYHYRMVSSVATGWERLLRLDTTTLRPLAWDPQISASNFDLVTHLGRFQLSSLSSPLWRPFH